MKVVVFVQIHARMPYFVLQSIVKSITVSYYIHTSSILDPYLNYSDLFFDDGVFTDVCRVLNYELCFKI